MFFTGLLTAYVPDTDFDTGQPTARGDYSLADATYGELLDKLADRRFAHASSLLSAISPFIAAIRPSRLVRGWRCSRTSGHVEGSKTT